MSSGYRLNESQASPLTSTHPEVGSCSNSHQSLLTLPPSIWWAAVAVPQTKRSGKSMGTDRYRSGAPGAVPNGPWGDGPGAVGGRADAPGPSGAGRPGPGRGRRSGLPVT